MIPYQKVRYHLKEWDRAGSAPENAKELFNLRHSVLRNVVERTFGCIKHRFTILTQQRRGFSIRTQCKVVYACVALHNWLNGHGSDPEADADAAEDRNLTGDGGISLAPEGHTSDERRDTIAVQMFRRYMQAREEVRL
jgi:DDE superfamily endonuclease